MKTTITRVLSVSLTVIMVLPFAFFAINGIRIKIRMHNLKVADHKAILASCRYVIEHRNEYRNDKNKWGTLYEDDVLILAPLPIEIPESLRKLKPHYLLIREQYIIINMRLPFCRLGLIAFLPGANEYGTFKYINGLWFWNGNFESKGKK